MDRREHHRAQLNLPVRIRWNTPFEQKIEVCKTLDISRGGLLVPCQEEHAPGTPLWITFPYDPALADGQPEILAKVVRAAQTRNGNGNGNGNENEDIPQETQLRTLALRLGVRSHAAGNGNGHAKERERRENPRRAVAMPVRVRLEHVPWFEEAMTVDVSARGVRFLSNREYQPGQRLLVSFEPMAAIAWPTAAETPARILRVEGAPESATLAVTIVRES